MITSKNNEIVKFAKSLHQKKYRDEYKKYFVEGIKLVKEAIVGNMPIYKIIICEEILGENIDTKNYDVEFVNKAIFEYISDTKTPQGVLAIIDIQENELLESQLFSNSKDILNNTEHESFSDIGSTIFALDNIQDPGNLGTIIRTLDCAGINTLLLSKGTVDLYNPKVIRSTMGAIYRVKILENIDIKCKLQELQELGYKIVVTDLSAEIYHYDLNYNDKIVVVIGNEANGVSEEIKDIADIKIKIPMLGNTESLNAGVAASLIAYEKVRFGFQNLT